MHDRTRITVLCENFASRSDVLGEFGFAAWIETGSRKLLFDTGAGQTLAHNAERLGVPLAKTEALVLSHGHDDHTGGLPCLLKETPTLRIFAHPSALEQKYVGEAGSPLRRDGIPPQAQTLLRELEVTVIPTVEPTEVLPGVWATGEIPRKNDFEIDRAPRYRDPKGTTQDSLPDDQALAIETASGTVVVLGCAHAGVINTLDQVREFLSADRIHAVIGGMHLVSADSQRLEATIDGFRRLGVDLVIPMHCTGMEAASRFRAALGDGCRFAGAGDSFEF